METTKHKKGEAEKIPPDQSTTFRNATSDSTAKMFKTRCFDTDDGVRRAFRENGPFSTKNRSQIPNEDLEACLRADFHKSHGNESAENIESCITESPLLHPVRTTFGTFDNDTNLQESLHGILLWPRPRRQQLSTSKIVDQKCAGIFCVVLSLVSLGTVYFGFPVLKEFLIP